jgi:hypothetical protein
MVLVWSKNSSRFAASKIFKFLRQMNLEKGKGSGGGVIEDSTTDGNNRIYRFNRIGKTPCVFIRNSETRR